MAKFDVVYGEHQWTVWASDLDDAHTVAIDDCPIETDYPIDPDKFVITPCLD